MARPAVLLRTPEGVAYRVRGEPDAPWLVVCHGMALDHRDLRTFTDTLAGWRVLLWDMPGHGDSVEPGDWSVEGMADALAGVLTHARVERFSMIGFSFGGLVAQVVAKRLASRVDALVLYACFAPMLVAPMSRASARFALLAMRMTRWSRLRSEFARRCAFTKPARTYADRAADRLGKANFLNMTRALLLGGGVDETFVIDCPLLLVSGTEDANAKPLAEAAEALARIARSPRREYIADAGHCAHLDQPEAFTAVVGDFLASIRPDALTSNRSWRR